MMHKAVNERNIIFKYKGPKKLKKVEYTQFTHEINITRKWKIEQRVGMPLMMIRGHQRYLRQKNKNKCNANGQSEIIAEAKSNAKIVLILFVYMSKVTNNINKKNNVAVKSFRVVIAPVKISWILTQPSGTDSNKVPIDARRVCEKASIKTMRIVV